MTATALAKDLWCDIEQTLCRLLDPGEPVSTWFTKAHFMKTYTKAYEFCTIQREPRSNVPYHMSYFYADELYSLFAKFLAAFLTGIAANLQETADDGELVGRLASAWKRFEEAAPNIEAIFSYLERHWIDRQIEEKVPGVAHIRLLLWEQWHSIVMKSIEKRLFARLDSILARQRQQALVGRDEVVAKIIAIYEVLSSPVESAVTNAVLEPTINPYGQLLQTWYCRGVAWFCDEFIASSVTVAADDFQLIGAISQMNVVVESETARSECYLNSLGRKAVQLTIKDHLLSPVGEQAASLFERQLGNNFECGPVLKAIYRALSTRKSLRLLLSGAMERGFAQRLTRFVAIPAADAGADAMIEFVSACKRVVDDSSRILAEALGDNPELTAIRDNALRDLVNGPASVAEHLARWCDLVLRGPSPIDNRDLDFVVLVLRFLRDKDVFRLWYARLLARRLIANHDCSHGVARNSEFYLVAAFHATFGPAISQPLERMLTDIDLSREITLDFHGKHKKAKTECECGFSILSSGSWPISTPDAAVAGFRWPKAFQDTLDQFQSFYTGRHTGRVLKWLPQLSTVELVASFGTQSYTITVSCWQYVALKALQDSNCLGMNQMSQRTGIPVNILDSVLLAPLQANLIVHIDPDFAINPHFSHPSTRLNLSASFSLIPNSQESGEAARTILLDRLAVIQAAIVKYMKTNKHASTSKMVADIISDLSLRFHPSVSDITKALESLIERDFIKRDPKKPDYVQYIA